MLSVNNFNFKKDWFTTVLGLLIFFLGLGSKFMPNLQVDWTEAVGAMTFGLLVSGLKSPRVGENGGGIAVLLFCINLLAGCALQRNKTTITKTDSTTTTIVSTPKTIELPSDSATAILSNPCPTLPFIPIIGIQNGNENERRGVPLWPPYVQKGSVQKGNRNATAHIHRNKKGDIECNCNCDKYQATITEKNTTIFRLEKLNKEVAEIKPFVKEVIPWYAKIAMWWLIVCLLMAFATAVWFVAKKYS